jgi:hypothetical protein
MGHGSGECTPVRPLELFLLAKAVWVYDLVLPVPRGWQHNLTFRQLGASL